MTKAERDPRTDPRPGDVLEKRKKVSRWKWPWSHADGDYTTRRVTRLARHSIKYDVPDGADWREASSATADFLAWASSATVVKKGGEG